MRSLLAATLLTASLLAPPFFAHEYKLGSIEVQHPWSRATPATAPSAGGFLTVVCKGDAADRLVAVQSTAAERVQIHEMKMNGTIIRMGELDNGVALPRDRSSNRSPAAITSCSSA